jgi:hypothetical protein
MEPNPSNVSPWYLRNITQALALDEATGNVYVRTGFEGNIIISGNVNIPGNVDAHISEIGTSGNLTVPWMPVSIDGNSNVIITSGNITVAGNVNALVTGNVTSTLSGNLAGITGNVTVVDGGGSITVDGNVGITGNVNIGTMPAVNANITGGNVTVQQGTSPWVISGNVGVTGGNVTLADDASVIISAFSGPTADAFGRLRISEPYTLFDTQNRYYDHGQFATETNGTANVVYEASSSTYMLNVNTASGDSVFRETLKPFPYQPGKSLLILQSFCMNTPKANLRQRTGFFSASNGVYFEANGTTLNMVIRSSSSGSLVEDRIAQANWNGDTLSGLGGASNPSGIALNAALDQIWFCDIEWLGAGSVRVGFIINGTYVICHTFHHANILGNTTTYMTTATLPLRFEITNTGTTASSSMLRQICSSVVSEGGFNLGGTGNPRAASHVIGSPVRLPNDSSFKPVIAIRLKSTALDAVVLPMVYTLTPAQQALFQYRVYKKAITSGGSWVSSAADSSVEYNLTPTALVSGDIAEQAFMNSSNQTSGSPTQVAFGFQYQLERQPFTGVAYEYVIMMATTGTNQDVYASIEWQEIT